MKRSRSVSDIPNSLPNGRGGVFQRLDISRAKSIRRLVGTRKTSVTVSGGSALHLGRVLLNRHIERPGHRFARGSHFRRHAQPIALETAVRLRGAIDHLDYDDRLVILMSSFPDSDNDT